MVMTQLFVGRKIDDKLRERIRKAYSNGESIYQISKDTGIHRNTISKIVADLARKRNQAKDERSLEQVSMDPVVIPTQRKYLNELSSYISHTMVRDTAKKLDAADTYIEIERTYRKSVENMGSDWNEFIDVAVQNLYDEMSEEYQRQLQEQERRKERKERMDFLKEAIEIKKMSDDK